jgi:hypothetical protein
MTLFGTLLVLLHSYIILLTLRSSYGDVRNKLDNEKTRIICRCPLSILQETLQNVSVKGRYYQLQDIEEFHPCMTSSLFGRKQNHKLTLLLHCIDSEVFHFRKILNS